MKEAVRLNKYLADQHYCSRREADRLIASGRVFINNKKANLGDKILPTDVVRVEGRDKKQKKEYTYLMINKPAGIVATQNRKTQDNVLAYVEAPVGVEVIGGMDVHDEGLLLMTDDKILINKMLKPAHAIDQEFVIQTEEVLNRSHIRQMQHGFVAKGLTFPASKVRHIDAIRFAIIMPKPDTHLIRKACTFFGYHVETVMRTRILGLKMPSTYPVGNHRHLTESEVRDLKKRVGMV